VTEERLQQHFAQHGSVMSARIITDKFSGRSRGFGFVEMSSAKEAEKATKALNGTDFEGLNIVVNEARPQAPRGTETGTTVRTSVTPIRRGIVKKLSRHAKKAHLRKSRRKRTARVATLAALVSRSAQQVSGTQHGSNKKQSARATGSTTVQIPETRYQSDKDKRRLDATRDYAHSFRDHGQFGSHPSHDRFDDDANP
jgi:RNA recognition motif-containing protein